MIILNVMLSAIMLIVVLLIVVLLSVIMLSVIMLSVIMLSVILLSIVAPKLRQYKFDLNVENWNNANTTCTFWLSALVVSRLVVSLYSNLENVSIIQFCAKKNFAMEKINGKQSNR